MFKKTKDSIIQESKDAVLESYSLHIRIEDTISRCLSRKMDKIYNRVSERYKHERERDYRNLLEDLQQDIKNQIRVERNELKTRLEEALAEIGEDHDARLAVLEEQAEEVLRSTRMIVQAYINKGVDSEDSKPNHL